MNTFQRSKLSMYHSVNSFLNDNKAVWEKAPGLVSVIAIFGQLLSTLVSVAGKKARNISGVVTARDQLRIELAELAQIISGGIVALATSLKNQELKKAMNFSISKLRYAAVDDLVPICNQILEEAKKNEAQLINFNITSAMIDAFAELTDDFNQSAPSPRKAISKRRSLGDTINELMTETDDVLKNQLDRLMLPYKKTDKLFYKEFRYNRVIVDKGNRSTRITGQVTDKTTGDPLKNVLVSVEGMGFFAKTETDGSFSIKVPKTGIVRLQFELDGYLTGTAEEVDVKLGKNTTISMELVKAA